MKKTIPNRWKQFSPDERNAIEILIREHLNAISEISLHKDFRVIGYLDYLAKLEDEIIESYNQK